MTAKTYKKKNRTLNKTSRRRHHSSKKNQVKTNDAIISLKPFEASFSKEIATQEGKKLRNIHTYKTAEFAKELHSRFSPSNIKPQHDFYDYINYTWLQNVSLEKQQKYIVQIDDFRLAQDKVYQELGNIIVDYYNTNNNTLAKNLKHYYTSVIDMNPISYSKQLAKQAVDTIEQLIAQNNPWALLAHFNKDEMMANNAPFVWAVNQDDKDPTISRCYLYPMQLLMANISVYYDDGTDKKYKEKYLREYHKYVKTIFDVALGPNHSFHTDDCYQVQVDVFNAMGCIDITSKDEKSYNKIGKREALEKYGFDWEEFSRQLGFSHCPDFFITSSVNYLKCGTDLFLKQWKTPQWKTYWVYLLLRQIVRITKDWEKVVYNFHAKFERGQEQINVSDNVSAALYMSVPFNTFLTNAYIEKYENPQAMLYAETLCNELKIVFRRILSRNKWLQPSTKKYALKKLDHFNFVFGKPDYLAPDPPLTYGTMLYDNMKMLHEWRCKEFISMEGKKHVDLPMMDWTNYPVKMTGSQAYIVNASYTPSKNSIYINLGYIQKPFVDLDERGIEYNLAHLGFTIGHEMSHGFDDFGSQYGHDGKLYDWWTPKDKQKYKEMQKDVIRQYEEFAKRDNITFDASISIGEDLADISGLAICDEYLRDFQDNHEDIIPIRALSYESFYTYFAFQQRQLVRPKAISAQLKTNPHPLDKYRCNVPLSRSQIYRALYNVKRGDGMWWHNTNTIW